MGKKIAAHVLMFNCDQFILHMIDNCGPFVDKIYVAYGTIPWKYNKNARGIIRNKSDLNILKESKFFEKIEVIIGAWDYDEEQRNTCLEKAREDGFDYLVVHDADEYYFYSDYQANIQCILDNPDYDLYRTPWCTFWKTTNYIIESKNKSIILGYPEFAINLNSDVRFVNSRITNAKSSFVLKGLCHHLSYVYSDNDLHEKIQTWAHSIDFDSEKWYKRKWLNWNIFMENLHPIEPDIFKRAKKYQSILPEVLKNFRNPEFHEIPISPQRKLMTKIINNYENCIILKNRLKERIYRTIH